MEEEEASTIIWFLNFFFIVEVEYGRDDEKNKKRFGDHLFRVLGRKIIWV